MLIFDDDSTDKDNRQEVFQRLGQVTLPAGLQPQMGTDWSPVGQIYWYTLRSTNPAYDGMELKSLEDWKLEKEFKSVPGVVDVSSFGGITREYQVRLDPDKLIAYGLSIAQVEQQIANNNVNAGGNFIEQGEQQINVREVGLFTSVHDIEETVLKTQNGTALRVKDIATVVQGPRSASARSARPAASARPPSTNPIPPRVPTHASSRETARAIPIEKQDGKLIDNPDVVEGIVLLQKGDNSDATLEGIHKKGRAERDDQRPPARSQDRSLPRPQRPAALHHAHGAEQPHRGHLPRRHHPVFLPRQCARRGHCRPHHAVRPALRGDLPGPARHPRQPALAGRAGLRHGGGRLRGDDGEHRPPSQPQDRRENVTPTSRSARPRTRCSAPSSSRAE